MSDTLSSHDDALQRTFRGAYFLALVGCFTPSKILGYLLPSLVALLLVVRVPGVPRDRALRLAAVLIVVGLVYSVIAPEFLLQNYLLAVLTYSTFAVVFIVPSRGLASRELLGSLLVPTVSMVGLQGLVGTVQALYGTTQTGSFAGSNGDFVTGTIHFIPEPQLTASNPIFAINLAFMLVMSLALLGRPGKVRRSYLALGACAFVLASVVHVLIFLAGASVAAYLVVPRQPQHRRPARRRLGRGMIAVIVLTVAGLAYGALRRNFSLISEYASSTFDLDAASIPRAIMIGRVITDLPVDAPMQPFVGLGPGQFSSRASLIASGLYLGGPDDPKSVPFLTPQTTKLADNYCISLLLSYATQDDVVIGSTQQPFSSCLSIYTELGLAGVLLIIVFSLNVVRQVRLRVRRNPQLRFNAMLFMICFFLLILLGFQDNYWEMPQAILCGCMLMKVLYAGIVHGEMSGETPSGPMSVSRAPESIEVSTTAVQPLASEA